MGMRAEKATGGPQFDTIALQSAAGPTPPSPFQPPIHLLQSEGESECHMVPDRKSFHLGPIFDGAAYVFSYESSLLVSRFVSFAVMKGCLIGFARHSFFFNIS